MKRMMMWVMGIMLCSVAGAASAQAPPPAAPRVAAPQALGAPPALPMVAPLEMQSVAPPALQRVGPGCDEEVMALPPDFEMPDLSGLDAEVAANLDMEAEQAGMLAQLGDLQQEQEEMATPAPRSFTFKTPDAFFGDEMSGGYLGVGIAEVTTDTVKELKLESQRGVLVKEVAPDSPAAKAGLKENDVVLAYDNQPVQGAVQFRRLVRETPSGHTVNLKVWRDGNELSVPVQINDRMENTKMKMDNFRMSGSMDGNKFFVRNGWGPGPTLGVSAENLNAQLGSYFGVANGEGVLVREVHAGSAADKAGLKAGDVIVKVGDAPVKDASELREQLSKQPDQKSVALGIVRHGAPSSVNVTIEAPKAREHRVEVRQTEL
jgi:serine protease Do